MGSEVKQRPSTQHPSDLQGPHEGSFPWGPIKVPSQDQILVPQSWHHSCPTEPLAREGHPTSPEPQVVPR